MDGLQVLADATNINQGAAKHWTVYKCWLSHQSSIMELRINKMLYKCTLSHEHQSWSCEKQDALQVLTVAPSINHGAAKNWMIYKCWLSQQATGWFTWSMSTSKSRSGGRSREKLEALPLLTVAKRCLTSVHCRHKHQSWICWKLNALQVLIVAISINRASGVGTWAGVAKSWTWEKTERVPSADSGHKHKSKSCETWDALQVLTVATSINHGAAKKQNALQVLTVATGINPGSGVGAWAVVSKSWTCEKLDVLPVLAVATNINHGAAKNGMLYIQVLTVPPSINHGAANKHDALQVLTVVTSINHGTAKSWMFYKCSLSHQASIMELRKTGWFTNADCCNKQVDDLQIALVGVRVRVGVAIEKKGCFPITHCRDTMLDKCLLSPPTSIVEMSKNKCFTSADCRNWPFECPICSDRDEGIGTHEPIMFKQGLTAVMFIFCFYPRTQNSYKRSYMVHRAATAWQLNVKKSNICTKNAAMFRSSQCVRPETFLFFHESTAHIQGLAPRPSSQAHTTP